MLAVILQKSSQDKWGWGYFSWSKKQKNQMFSGGHVLV